MNYKTKKKPTYIDITDRKTVTIQRLKREVKDASTILSKSNATYSSFVNKQVIFSQNLTLAQSDYNSKKVNWDLLLKLKSSLYSLKDTSDATNEVAQSANEQVKKMIKKWHQVTDNAIRAADSINLTANYVVKRKAANPLLSNDLVNEVTKAAKTADNAIKIVITAMTNALTSLSSSNKANNSSLLTNNEVNLAISMIVLAVEQEFNLVDKPRTLLKKSGFSNAHIPLEGSLKKSLLQAKLLYDQLLISSENVNTEVAKSKEELEVATAHLATLESALKAAEAAVAG